ncbi:ABC transporter substrate-binding protein [Jatrophihabitans telluris]|uniref:ABC transporter substrate-binding protein n=1 Tax=Jatrophihabitans telluris TaxID=2038343 RepID=A0ABY4R028_9ACTN|nr:ABC transporter substrate-binding protein [Jatrophihabitans telluris]UQX89180.1 ABC transporter substrate-binding protein [Jatrophihabitans telluris]
MRLVRSGAAAVMAAVLTAAGLAGCSSSGSKASSSGGTGAVNLSFWNGLTGPDKAAVDQIISSFNSSHPNIKVTSDPIPWDVLYTKLLPAFGAGKGPDLVGISSDQLPGYASKHVLQPIDSMFSNGVDKSTIVPSALNAGIYGGKQYGVPIESTPVMLYYNKKMFSAAGISKAPANWDEWAADAKKLTLPGGTGGNPKQYGMAIGTNNTVELMPILMWMADGGILSDDGKNVLLNNAGSKQAIQYWANLIHDNHISPTGLTGGDADKLIESAKAAMEVNGPWATTGYKAAGIDYGLAPVPVGPNGKNASVGVTTVLGVSSKANAEKMKAASTFYAYWTQQSSQTNLSLKSGFPPVTTNVPGSALSANPDVAAFAAQAGSTRALAPGQTSFAAIQNDVYDPTIEKIIANPGQTGSLLDQAATQVQGMLSTGG